MCGSGYSAENLLTFLLTCEYQSTIFINFHLPYLSVKLKGKNLTPDMIAFLKRRDKIMKDSK